MRPAERSHEGADAAYADHCTMTEHRVRHLPVISDDELVGLVSIGEFVAAVTRDQATLIEQRAMDDPDDRLRPLPHKNRLQRKLTSLGLPPPPPGSSSSSSSSSVRPALGS